MLCIIFAMGYTKHIRSAARPVVLLRASLEFVVSLLYVTAISHLPISDLTSIMQATPIIMTVLCAVLRIEIVSWQRWAAVLVGFVGVLLITQPGGSSFSIFTLAALGSATFVALRDLVTPRIGADVPPPVVILTTTIFAAGGGFLLGLSETWVTLQVTEYVYLAGAAIIVSAANVLMVIAYRNADISLLSPLRYTVVVWAAIAGLVVFGELPGLIAAIGTLMIVLSGLYTGYQERARNRKAQHIPDIAT
jgi:drug/metabolite transporter (DMT)-like permease